MSNIKIFLLFICIIICKNEEEDILNILLKKLSPNRKMQKMVVVGGDNEPILKCCRKAKDLKIVDTILVGDVPRIKSIAAKIKTDISDFELVDIKDPAQMARYAVKLVHDKKVDMYAKGSVETKIVLQALLNKEIGLRTGKSITAVSVFHSPEKKKFILMSDAIIRPYPTLKDKIAIINNCVDIAHVLGIKKPKVAPLAAIEVVNPKMIETVEADELKKMYEKGEFKDCIVDGPLSLDLALDPEAARIKNIGDRKIQGDADILILPDIHAGNIAYKIFTHIVGWKGGNIITGTSAPVILPSRSDSQEFKFISILLASLYGEYLKTGK